MTSFQDAGTGFATIDLLRSMAEAGELGVRLWVMLSESNDALEARAAEYRVVGAADDHLTVRAIKRLRRRRARLPRRLAARAVHGPAREQRA